MRRSVRTVVASSLLAVLVLSADVTSQDKKPAPTPVGTQEKKPDAAPAPAPAPAQPQEKKTDAAPVVVGQQTDRIDIGSMLDSWYKVMQGAEPVGYSHEVLQRAQPGNPWRYQYIADHEVELQIIDSEDSKRNNTITQSLRIRAQLDDTYAPISMERADKRNETEVMSTVLTEDSGKKIDIVLGPTDRRPHTVNNDEEVHYSHFLMFVSLRQNGKLSKAGPQRVVMFTPSEDNRSPLSEVQIEVHDLVKRKYFGDKEVAVTRVTYLKPPPAPSRDAELMETFVDKFGRIVEESTRGGLKRILVKDEIEAVGRNERVRPGARRDPFRKDLAMYFNPKIGKGIVGGPTVEPPDPSNMAATFKKLEDLIEDMRKAKEEKRDEEGQKQYERFLDIHASVRALNAQKPLPPEQMARVETLRKQAEEVWGGLERLMKMLQQTYVKVIEAFNRDEVGQMEAGIAEFKKAQNRKELDDQPQLTQVLKWIGELEPLVAKCKTRIELGRKRVVVTGTMLHDDAQLIPVDAAITMFGHQVGGIHEVRFIKPNRMAVINDKLYRVGDVVEGEGVKIEKIWAFGVQVSLREEVRDVGIRQK